jgi:hypothetical protein
VRLPGDEYEGRSSAFEIIFRENRWNNAESVSGSGSTLENTNMLQSVLERAIRKTNACTILDAPCGDFNWMKNIKLPDGADYIGGDIVTELTDRLQQKYGGDARTFRHLDIATDQLPRADLWLCRHVLFHLSNSDIRAVFRNFARSDIAYLLTENFAFQRTNEDIRSGGFRLFNLRLEPFGLPPSLAKYPNSNPPNTPDYLNLWSREQIAEVVARWDRA